MLLAITLLLASSLAVHAQPLAVDDNYRLQSGDVIIVSVLGEERLGGTLPVGAGGSIPLPIVGSVPVVGKTLSETRDLVARLYSDVIRRPYVSVALDENASRRKVFVSGRVEKPGPQLLPFGSTVTDAVVAAGFTEEADLAAVTVRHASGELATVDLTGLRTAQPLPINLPLSWEDRIFVPTYDQRLTVLGEVTRPGSYTVPLGRTFRVVDALTQLAGGLTAGADRARAMLIRHGESKPEEIDLVALMQRGELRQNYALQGGDVLLVPQAGRITIAGEVAGPASIVPDHPITVLEALIRSGGFTPLAGLRQAELRRGTEVCKLDLEALWRRGDMTQNIELKAGDVLIVPRAPQEEVLVLGAVLRPGTTDIRDQENRSLLKILGSSGKAPSADYSRVSIYRGDEHIVANATAALELGDMRHNPQLQPGDVIFVPDVGKIALLGAFSRAGLVDYDPKLTLLDYVTLGGLAGPQSAHLESGILIRTRPDGTHETVKLDISQLQRGIMPEPVKVKPGDVIYFQAKGEKAKGLWESLREILWTVGSLRGLL